MLTIEVILMDDSISEAGNDVINDKISQMENARLFTSPPGKKIEVQSIDLGIPIVLLNDSVSSPSLVDGCSPGFDRIV